jgi:hypothetical protein
MDDRGQKGIKNFKLWPLYHFKNFDGQKGRPTFFHDQKGIWPMILRAPTRFMKSHFEPPEFFYTLAALLSL